MSYLPYKREEIEIYTIYFEDGSIEFSMWLDGKRILKEVKGSALDYMQTLGIVAEEVRKTKGE